MQVPDSSTLPPSSARPQEDWLSRADLLELASGKHDALQGAFYEASPPGHMSPEQRPVLVAQSRPGFHFNCMQALQNVLTCMPHCPVG